MLVNFPLVMFSMQSIFDFAPQIHPTTRAWVKQLCFDYLYQKYAHKKIYYIPFMEVAFEYCVPLFQPPLMLVCNTMSDIHEIIHSRLPIMQGATPAFFPPLFAILALPKWSCPEIPGTNS